MATTALICTSCGYKALQWVGRCPSCGAWDSFDEVQKIKRTLEPLASMVLSQVDLAPGRRLRTGIAEVDRVSGGGFVAGSIALIAGEPGVGKSTLMLQIAGALDASGKKVTIVCGEESIEQVAARANRVLEGLAKDGQRAPGNLPETLALGGETAAFLKIEAASTSDAFAAASVVARSDVVIVDSIQTMRHPDQPGEPGSVNQVRSSAAVLAEAARKSGAVVLLVGHVTKDGSIAGPRALEHLVDSVFSFDGERTGSLRMLRAVKNRFGPTNEVGVFEMKQAGLEEVLDASGRFLCDHKPGVPGSVISCIVDGVRPIGLEVQALITKSKGSFPRRIVSGPDSSRLVVIAAVLDKRTKVKTQESDIYAAVSGGIRTADPGIDLALALAVAGSQLDKAMPARMVAVGEIGLGGEVRTPAAMGQRLEEAARIGATDALTPSSWVSQIKGLRLHPLSSVAEALEVLE